MSYESLDRPAHGLLAKIRQAVFGLPHPPPKYAHPWSAYSPANFHKDDTARNIVPTQATGTPLPAADVISLAATTTGDNLAVKASTKRCERTPNLPEVAACETRAADISVIEAVIFELIAKQKQRKLAAVEASKSNSAQPIVIGSGVDFQLAARLRCVSVLNRKVTATGTARSTKRSGTNRPIKKLVAPTRRLRVEPPAVQRKKRLSADVVYLKFALNRAEHKQARMLVAA